MMSPFGSGPFRLNLQSRSQSSPKSSKQPKASYSQKGPLSPNSHSQITAIPSLPGPHSIPWEARISISGDDKIQIEGELTGKVKEIIH